MPSSAFFVGIWDASLMLLTLISFGDGGRREAKNESGSTKKSTCL